MEEQRLRASENTRKSYDSAVYLLARADAVSGVPCMPRPVSPQGAMREGPQSPAAAMATLQAEAEAFVLSSERLVGAGTCVFGEGNAAASIVFVGGLTSLEDQQASQPLGGPAGHKLDDILKAMKLSRSDVYLCTIVKSCPPDNRAVCPDDVTAWLPWFHRQMRIIQPDIIVALGSIAAEAVLQMPVDMATARGTMGVWVDPDSGQQVAVMPTFDPAYLLEHYTPEVRGQVWGDMKAVLARAQAGMR